MTVRDAYDYLIKTLAPLRASDTDDQRIAMFLSSLLAENNVNTLRLLICLAIDVKSSIKKLKDSSRLTNPVLKAIHQCIIDAFSVSIPLRSTPSGINGLHNLLKFSIAQRIISPQFFSPCVKCDDDHSYSRISSFRSYMLYVVDINRDPKLNPGLTEDIDENELDRYHSEFLKNKYRNVKLFNIGRKYSWVFIAKKSEIKNLGYKNTRDILDRLGFYTGAIEPGGRYVCIEYDDSFSEDTYQPNTLTGDWGSLSAKVEFNGNDFFLSYFISDNWGRTFSVTGSKERFKERVHRDFNYAGTKYYEINAYDLAPLLIDLVPSDEDEIIEEALDRFSKS